MATAPSSSTYARHCENLTALCRKSFDNESRAVIINNPDTIIKIPADEMIAMKTSLSLLGTLSGKLEDFKVNAISEHSIRDVSTEWVATDLRTEEIPAISITLKPWTYIYIT